VPRIDGATAVVLGAPALTPAMATVGINVVANPVSPASAFSNVAPRPVGWRAGGMIAAVGSAFPAPWNPYKDPAVTHHTRDVLGAFIGPPFGILICGPSLVERRRVAAGDLCTTGPSGRCWDGGGHGREAMSAPAAGAALSILRVTVPAFRGAADITWFIGVTVGFPARLAPNRRRPATGRPLEQWR
jgi:NCS1 family nucleobase:cation symporter-1